mgnify:CR=1 FL=1
MGGEEEVEEGVEMFEDSAGLGSGKRDVVCPTGVVGTVGVDGIDDDDETDNGVGGEGIDDDEEEYLEE